jgi:predicted Zn-ribbon and HTH transcriptional regulator
MPTLRENMADRLRVAWQSPRDLAEIFGLKIRDVIDDLEHIRQSHRRLFEVQPPECKRCDFVFETRKKLSTPSRCPRCRCERIREPLFRIRDEGPG